MAVVDVLNFVCSKDADQHDQSIMCNSCLEWYHVICTLHPFEKSSKIEVLVLLILQIVNFVYISHASLCNQLRELYFSCVDFPQLFNIY